MLPQVSSLNSRTAIFEDHSRARTPPVNILLRPTMEHISRSFLFYLIFITVLIRDAVSSIALAEPRSYKVLGNQGSSTRINIRVELGVDASTIICSWSHNGNAIEIDGTKYVNLGSRSIQINNIVGSDEGAYACTYNYAGQQLSGTVANIYVIGVAEFVEKQGTEVSANVGGTARFDTRVTFAGWGPQHQRQKVNLLQLFKGSTQVYRCRNWNSYEASPCGSEGRFAVEKIGSYKYDFFLVLSDVQLDDGGIYEARLEVIDPVTGSYSVIRKTITLNVTAPLLPPVVSIESTGEPNKGETYGLWCNFTIQGDDMVHNFVVSWQHPNGTEIKSTSSRTGLGLVLSNLSKEDEGRYTCLVSVGMQGSEEQLSANASVEVILNVDVSTPSMESFQLCIGPFFLSDCSALAVDSEKGIQLENEIRNEITRNVLKHCPGCLSGSSGALIQPGTLRCSENAARLIYRSKVAEAYNATKVVQVIEEWVSSTVPGEATLRLWPFVMDLDNQCPVSIASLDSPYPALGSGQSQLQFKESVQSCLAKDFSTDVKFN